MPAARPASARAARPAARCRGGSRSHRDRIRAAGVDRHLYLQAPVAQARLVVEIVAERKHLEQLGPRIAPAQVAPVRVSVSGAGLARAPTPAGRLSRRASAGRCRRARRGSDLGTSTVRPADAVLEAGEPVRPRVQQRDAHRLAALRIGADACVLGEQLIAPMAQRAADHPRAGNERRLQCRLGVAQTHAGKRGIGHEPRGSTQRRARPRAVLADRQLRGGPATSGGDRVGLLWTP